MSIRKRLGEDILSRMNNGCGVLMGDADFCALIEESKSLFSAPLCSDTFLRNNKITFMGADIFSNGMPGTTGWVIGTKEQIEQMRAAVWSHRYYHLFKDVPDGYFLTLKDSQ